jgi:hypothetical protein
MSASDSMASSAGQFPAEEMRDYVAHVQLQMALQARNLVPTISTTDFDRSAFIQQSQASYEVMASRQRR